MSYNDFLAIHDEPSEECMELDHERSKSRREPEHDYDHVRFGTPSGTVKFEESKKDLEILISHFLSNGYSTWPSSKITQHLKRHVALFRASLDLWDNICPIEKSMCKEEIYYRCLTEGPQFTEWVKKARSTSLRFASSETNTEIDEEYLLDNYKGYNSMINEKYLIHWDDTKDIDDVKYSFIPARNLRGEDFRKRVKRLFKDFRIGECDFSDSINMIDSIKNSVINDPKTGKNVLMREVWSEGIEPVGPYFASRRVVPIHPGGTRDTGVGDPASVLKVKQLNQLSRTISEKLPYSANAPDTVCNARLKRVLKRNGFIHLDFKKFGLSFPRLLTNILIEEIGVVSKIDTSHLIFTNFI